MYKSVHSSFVLFQQLGLSYSTWEVSEHKTVLGGSSESKKLNWNLFSNYRILIVGLYHVSYTMEEAVIKLLVLASLFGDFVQELAHGHDWYTQVN